MALASSRPSLERAGVDAHLEALHKLEKLVDDAAQETARHRSNRLLKRAVRAWRKGDIAKAGKWALKAVEADGENPKAFHVLAMSLERMGHLHKALVTYERAFQLDPHDPELWINLGLTAWGLNLTEGAAKMFRLYIDACPDFPLGYNNLGIVQADMGQPDLAIETLRAALYRMPGQAILWNALATVLAEEGRADESLVFYQEATNLEPGYARAYHNQGYALQHLSRMKDAIDCYDKSLSLAVDPADRIEGRHSRSVCLIGLGRLEEGFQEYEIRNDQRFRAYVHHLIDAPLWTGQNPAGKKLLLVAEQGLGDEIMFANIVPDVQAAVGEKGTLQIGVDPRLVPLFRRSFPRADVGTCQDRTLIDADGNKAVRMVPFASGSNRPDFWAPMGTALRFYRKSIEAFPRKAFLIPDPKRVNDFRSQLSALPGRKVGICWRSMMMSNKRKKYFAPIDLWGSILTTPGVSFVNLQYGDCQAEIARAKNQFGVTIHEMADLDLKQDIDGTAALAAALDLVISAPTAAAHTSASVGAPVWFLSFAQGWPQLGTEEYPWYADTRVFQLEKCADWNSVMPRLREAIIAWAAE